ncbi:unnamed protein product [marine sediment metagenome]|uniref:Uncharacterized protein n=1 Tax=marine sediment metagenome TaxID=412755 RepID=X1PCQ6_9ZZZZ
MHQPGLLIKALLDENYAHSQSYNTKEGDLVREHRRGIAPTYGDLLGGERFNPSDPKQLTYAQAKESTVTLFI